LLTFEPDLSFKTLEAAVVAFDDVLLSEDCTKALADVDFDDLLG
jgi:hypothetical protein